MKRFAYFVFCCGTFITVFAYFLACLTPFISPAYFWPSAFLALGFPYLLLSVIALIVVWLLVKRKVAIALLLIVFVGSQNIYSSVAINAKSDFSETKSSGSLRILSWNVKNFDNAAIHADGPYSTRRAILNYLEKSNADVLCLQEFAEHTGPSFLSNIQALHEIGYKYDYRTSDLIRDPSYGHIVYGSAIFSKIPLLDSGKTMLGDPSFPEHIGFADIVFNGKPLRIFATHFKSLNLFVNGFPEPENIIPFHYDSTILYTAGKFEKLRIFGQDHAREAEISKTVIDRSPYPVVFTADLNSVPTSYPYHRLSENLQDCFLKKGRGFGKSFNQVEKILRIDYILADKKLEVINYTQDQVYFSDHFPHIIDVRWKR